MDGHAMTTMHDLHSFYAGDDWQINGSLFDIDGQPLDITSANIEWALLNFSQEIVLNGSSAQIQIIDAVNGKITILVPNEATAPLVAGEYNDVLRVTIGSITDTMWVGGIVVKKALS
jgi:hypothetical protein